MTRVVFRNAHTCLCEDAEARRTRFPFSLHISWYHIEKWLSRDFQGKGAGAGKAVFLPMRQSRAVVLPFWRGTCHMTGFDAAIIA